MYMRFDIITIFPKAFDSYFNESIIKRAREKKLIDIRIHNLRDFSKVALRKTRSDLPPRRQIDDRPFGGGPGMVMKIESLVKALSFALGRRTSKSNVLVILFSAGGKQFNSKMAIEFGKKYNRVIMICGHYEGVDERIKKIIRDLGLKIQELSIGNYVLTGGELPAMVLIDAVSRHVPGVLGTAESLEETRYGVGVPVYTRPEVFVLKGKKYKTPKVLLSGNHAKIDEWRRAQLGA